MVARASAAVDELYSSEEKNVGHPGGRTEGVTLALGAVLSFTAKAFVVISPFFGRGSSQIYVTVSG